MSSDKFSFLSEESQKEFFRRFSIAKMKECIEKSNLTSKLTRSIKKKEQYVKFMLDNKEELVFDEAMYSALSNYNPVEEENPENRNQAHEVIDLHNDDNNSNPTCKPNRRENPIRRDSELGEFISKNTVEKETNSMREKLDNLVESYNKFKTNVQEEQNCRNKLDHKFPIDLRTSVVVQEEYNQWCKVLEYLMKIDRAGNENDYVYNFNNFRTFVEKKITSWLVTETDRDIGRRMLILGQNELFRKYKNELRDMRKVVDHIQKGGYSKNRNLDNVNNTTNLCWNKNNNFTEKAQSSRERDVYRCGNK